ncbi:hypothetical protein AC1031_007803 [Aphanomyces cochlioides]|nr:hypothetical protein AC1031_007803 [Aphanomyces cochlioides]
MQRMDASQNKALAVVYHIAPDSALSLLPIALLVEGEALSQSVFVQTPALWGECILFLIAGGILSFVLIYVEVELVKKTSALSLGIAGNLKDVMQILMAMLVFHDQLSAINAAGLCIATLGLMSYSYLKATAAASKSLSTRLRASYSHDVAMSGICAVFLTDYVGGMDEGRQRPPHG